MAGRELSVRVDTRKLMKEHVVVRVQMLGIFWVRLGFAIMKIGAWIAGAKVVEEFPMSLIQPDQKE